MNAVPQDQGPLSGDKKAGSSAGPESRRFPVLAAVDLGAESCRISLLRWVDGEPEIRLVHRFPNSASADGTGLHWDIGAICKGVEDGLRTCAQLAPEGIAAIGAIRFAIAMNARGKRKSACIPEFLRNSFTNLLGFRFSPSTPCTN